MIRKIRHFIEKLVDAFPATGLISARPAEPIFRAGGGADVNLPAKEQQPTSSRHRADSM
jgi:hypothetical protein